MKPTTRASPLARVGFHPHFAWKFIWRTSSGKKARYLGIIYNFLSLWIKISNEQCIGIKMSGPPARASPLFMFIMKIFSPPRQDLGQSMVRSCLRGLALQPCI